MISLTYEEIRLVERNHYYMQLSAYFTELIDLPGVRYAFTSRLSDTWYNQAYDVDWMDLDPSDLVASLSEVCDSKNRAPCVYTSPANRPADVAQLIEEQGLSKFEEESWMFLPLDEESSLGLHRHEPTIVIHDVSLDEHLTDFANVYRRGLPGPEVEDYVAAVINGLRYAPPGVDVHYLLAFLGDEAVGMLSLLSCNGMSGIYAVATVEQFRRRGVARSLVRRGVELARGKASQYLFLQTETGAEAEEAFHRIGFETAFRRSGYTTPAVVASLSHG